MDGGIGMAQVVCCAFKLRLDGGTDKVQIYCSKFELKYLALP